MKFRRIRRLYRLTLGWWRLTMHGICPHCMSDAGEGCPICHGLWRETEIVGDRYLSSEVWVRYVNMINALYA